jgi:hypothetical protein
MMLVTDIQSCCSQGRDKRLISFVMGDFKSKMSPRSYYIIAATTIRNIQDEKAVDVMLNNKLSVVGLICPFFRIPSSTVGLYFW